MEFLIIAIITLVLIIVLKNIFDYNMKKIKDIGKDDELDEMAKKYPNNIEICKDYLKRLKNENVKIEENKDSEASLYIAMTDKISIANIENTHTRIQTIAHECLHSIQERKILMFNFIFSNIYIIFYISICIFGILKLLPYKMMFLNIFLLFSLVYYTVRVYLENDAMIKARFLAKEYMEEKKISSEEEIRKIVSGFDKINNVGIKCVNYHFFLEIMVKVLIFSIICFIR